MTTTGCSIKFEVDNSAFSNNDGPGEVARILRDLATKIENGRESGQVMDANGNSVGQWSVEFEQDNEEWGDE